jgi:uncharacterized membrane protein
MMRWIAPMVVGIACAAGAWYFTMSVTPYVLMEVATQRITTQSPWNSFTHAPPVNARRQFVVRPSPDLLYSTCPFDLSAGPVEVTAVPVPDRYSSISVFDSRTDVVFVKNDEQMAGQPMRVVLALAGQQVPAGVEVVRLRTPKGIVLQRVLLADPAEAATVDPIRSQARCAPLGRSAVS